MESGESNISVTVFHSNDFHFAVRRHIFYSKRVSRAQISECDFPLSKDIGVEELLCGKQGIVESLCQKRDGLVREIEMHSFCDTNCRCLFFWYEVTFSNFKIACHFCYRGSS
ncbi:hypothetical protein CDAR_609441 [Caerostris darwini]|uniref:Uncharacterized protein n=1 Tax=Caerostris darwini TaxID=1538125 RepID=A0AAV4VWR5_9ARAC|nr:hypothetical protein CDAR_609441 [Caerostris darwini]